MLIVVVIVQRLAELVLARRNTQRLLARGGREVGASHYPMIVALHAAWILALVVFGWDASVSLAWLGIYILLQVLRVWILASLGPRWTTRIIIIDEPQVRHGPYRLFPHPNYLLVAAELIAVPVALGLPWIALVFTLLNAVVIAIRISVENQALASISPCRDLPSGGIN